MASGGCITHRNALDAVEFSVLQGHKHPTTSAPGVNATMARRSDTLHDKDALLYKGKKKNSFHRRSRIPDEDEDWGVPSARRRGGISTPRSSPAPSTVSNNRTSQKNAFITKSPRPATTMKNNLHTLTASERHRSIEKPKSPTNQLLSRNTKHSSENIPSPLLYPTERLRTLKSQVIPFSGNKAPSTSGAVRPRSSSIRQISSHMRDEQDNHHFPLFESVREETPILGRRGRRSPLFEQSRQDYDAREKKRLQAIVDTVHSMELSHQAETSTAESRDKSARRDERHEIRDRVDPCWGGLHLRGDLEDDRYVHNGTPTLGHTLKAEMLVEPKVSDLSSFTGDKAIMTGRPQPLNGPVERAALKMQRALAKAKTEIYPMDKPAYFAKGEEDDIFWEHVDDARDDYGAMDRTYGSRQSSREPSFATEMPLQTPKRSNMNKNRQSQLYAKSYVEPLRTSRSKSPATMGAGSLKKQSTWANNFKDTNDHIQEEYSNPKTRNLVGSSEPMLKQIPLQRSKSHDSARCLGRSRSVTPTKQISVHPDAKSSGTSMFQRSKSSSRLRPMTPNQLLRSRRNLNESIGFMDLVAEQQLKEIRERRNQHLTELSQGVSTKTRDLPQKQRKNDGSRQASHGGSRAQQREDVTTRMDRRPVSRSRPTHQELESDEYYRQGLAENSQRIHRLLEGEQDMSTIRHSYSRSPSPRAIRRHLHSNDEGTRGQNREHTISSNESSISRQYLQAREMAGQNTFFEDYPSQVLVENSQRNGGFEVEQEMSQIRQTYSRSPTPGNYRHRNDGRDFSSHSRDEARSTSRLRDLAGRLSSVVGSFDSTGRQVHHEKRREAKRSEKLKQDMIDFDSLMKAIGNDKKNTLGAEFAFVELGDEENVIQTHAILMNRDDIEDQLRAREPKQRPW